MFASLLSALFHLAPACFTIVANCSLAASGLALPLCFALWPAMRFSHVDNSSKMFWYGNCLATLKCPFLECFLAKVVILYEGLPWWLDVLLWCEGTTRQYGCADARSGGALSSQGTAADRRRRDWACGGRGCRHSRCHWLHRAGRCATPNSQELAPALSSTSATDVGPKLLEATCRWGSWVAEHWKFPERKEGDGTLWD